MRSIEALITVGSQIEHKEDLRLADLVPWYYALEGKTHKHSGTTYRLEWKVSVTMLIV